MKKHHIHGVLAAVLLFLIYFITLSVLNNVEHAVTQFIDIWYLMVPLVVGFGIQIGLFSFIRTSAKAAAGAAAASGSVSAGSMVACCLHHVTDVIPVIGLSAAAIFLDVYQPVFLLIGVVSNIVGIVFMMSIIQKRNLHNLGGISKYNLSRTIKPLIVVGIVVVAVTSIAVYSSQVFTANGIVTPDNGNDIIQLETKYNEENMVDFEVTPRVSGNVVMFDVGMNTHVVDLDFDPAGISELSVDGKIYYPDSWDGSPPGGHHRSGTLTFSGVDVQDGMKLTMRNAGGVDRIFVW